MILCDICNKKIKAFKAVPLEYREDGMRELCEFCSKKVFREIAETEAIEKSGRKDKIRLLLNTKKFKG